MERKQVVIIGGGSAGWITASIFAHVWQRLPVEITLIESESIETIGVGEGSTPALKGFFDHLGIPENVWMPRCNATYKCGIRFRDWTSIPSFSEYFHPFPARFDASVVQRFIHNVDQRRAGKNLPVMPSSYFLAAKLAEDGKAPVPMRSHKEFGTTYGYHFDAALLGKFLKEHAISRGVNHIMDTITETKLDSRGYIASITTAAGRSYSADLFVDCSGFRGLLINKALNVPWLSFDKVLFNDSAVAIPSSLSGNPESYTLSTALRFGWAWKIPLTNRYGNGYVYSSRYCSAEEAESELRSHLGMLDSSAQARHIKMRVGRVEACWHRNCLAIGLSQGFVEPLEATALFVVQQTASVFANEFRKYSFGDGHREKFNKQINNLLDGIKDYITAHYITNSRHDTDYWQDASAIQSEVSSNLRTLLQAWTNGGDVAALLQQTGMTSAYSQVSWYCLLAGMGTFSEVNAGTSAPEIVELPDLEQASLEFPLHQHVL